MIRKIQQASLFACIASVATVITVILFARVLDAKTFATALYVGMGATLVTGSAVVATYRD